MLQKTEGNNFNKMKYIRLTKGKFCLVDDKDFKKVSKYNWFVFSGRKNYAARMIKNIKVRKRQSMMFMHRMIMNSSENYHIDHINGDGLDNRRNNLRVCTSRQNSLNRSYTKKNKVGFKGVRLSKRSLSKGYIAQIVNEGKQVYLGYFFTKEDAARAYNKASIKFHGKYGYVNSL